jgi:DNA-binding protein YbaB
VELGADLDQMLTRSREMLRAMQAARPSDGDPPPEGTGEAAGGLIRAVAAGQRVTALELDPRVMRMASVELAEQVLIAVNAALQAQSPAGDAAGDPAGAVDPRALADELAKIQDQGIRQMTAISEAIAAAVAQMREATR